MHESHHVTLTLWPATPLPQSVARQLHRVGVDLSEPTVEDGWLTASRTVDGGVVLNLAFNDCFYGLTELEGVLAAARLAGLSYVAWDAKNGEIAGTGRSYDPDSGVEREFTVMSDGEPVLTRSDLDSLEHFETAEALLCEIRSWVRLPTPETLEEIQSDALNILIEDDETDEELTLVEAWSRRR
jgi:hypothetical protein